MNLRLVEAARVRWRQLACGGAVCGGAMRKYWRKLEAWVWSGLMEWETRGTVSDTKRGYETSVTVRVESAELRATPEC